MKTLTDAAEMAVGDRETVPAMCPACIGAAGEWPFVLNPSKAHGLVILNLCAEHADEALALQKGAR